MLRQQGRSDSSGSVSVRIEGLQTKPCTDRYIWSTMHGQASVMLERDSHALIKIEAAAASHALLGTDMPG